MVLRCVESDGGSDNFGISRGEGVWEIGFCFLGCRNGAIFPSEISARDKMTERGKSGREGKGMTISNQSICLFCTNL